MPHDIKPGILSDILFGVCSGPCVPKLSWSSRQGSGPSEPRLPWSLREVSGVPKLLWSSP
jgi:hypothetical protein